MKAPVPRSRTRLDKTAAVAVLVAATGIIAAVFAGKHGATRPTAQPVPESASGASAAPAASDSPRPAARRAAVPLVLTAADRRHCPATATACVDLTRHITWLQANGKTTFGPVQMEPGRPGGGHETPRGAFRVEWKAGPSYVSNIYHDPMPWATFFAAGGIAFHGGSLTAWSHGCVHLTDSNAHFYNENLPVGAQVVVF